MTFLPPHPSGPGVNLTSGGRDSGSAAVCVQLKYRSRYGGTHGQGDGNRYRRGEKRLGLRSDMHEIFLSHREISRDRSGMALREIFYIIQLSYFFLRNVPK